MLESDNCLPENACSAEASLHVLHLIYSLVPRDKLGIKPWYEAVTSSHVLASSALLNLVHIQNGEGTTLPREHKDSARKICHQCMWKVDYNLQVGYSRGLTFNACMGVHTDPICKNSTLSGFSMAWHTCMAYQVFC